MVFQSKVLQFGNGGYKMVFQPSLGNSGGMVTFWDTAEVECIALAQSKSWIWITVKVKRDDSRCHVVNIYSPLKLEYKKELWRDMEAVLECIADEPACFIRDFNCIRWEEEIMKCLYARRDVDGFNKLIDNSNLMEMGMINARFTWFGYDGRQSKLDRALVNSSWFMKSEWIVKALPKKHSDHKPILMMGRDVRTSSRPFRIFNYYLTDKLLQEVKNNVVLDRNWQISDVQHILRGIKGVVKDVSKGNKDIIRIDIEKLEASMNELEDVDWGDMDQLRVKQKLMELYQRRESMLRQKARMNWVALGDGNTNFFHQSIQRRRSVNNIHRLLWNKKWVTSPDQIREAIFRHFSEFFRTNMSSYWLWVLLSCHNYQKKEKKV